MPDLVLYLVPILVRREHGRHFDHDRNLSAALGSDSAEEVLLVDLKLVLTAAEDQIGVLWPAERPVVLDDKLLVDALAGPHPVVVGVLHAHEAHGEAVVDAGQAQLAAVLLEAAAFLVVVRGQARGELAFAGALRDVIFADWRVL